MSGSPTRQLISPRDLAHFALLGALVLPAWFLPRRTWPPAARLLGRLSAVHGRGRRDRIRQALSLGEDGARRLDHSVTAEAVLARMYLLHEHRPRPRAPKVTLTGAAHLDAALAGGRGAVLWVSPFCHSDLMTKRALFEAGYAVTHLSRPEHGGGASRFGRSAISPVYQSVENRFLDRRLLLDDAGSAPLRALVASLRANAPVSITALETGSQTEQVPFLGARIALARGPVSLARRASAPLLPVFTLRTGLDRFETAVLEPLPSRGESARETCDAYARLLEPRVRAHPEQWAGWRSLVDSDTHRPAA